MGVLRPSIYTLNPYVDMTQPKQLSYGNDQLKPKSSNNFQLSSNINLGRVYMRWPLTDQHSDRIILENRFLENDILHITKANIANRNIIRMDGYLSTKIAEGSFLRLNTSLNHIAYRARMLNLTNNGFLFDVRGQWEQYLLLGLYLELSGGYRSPYIFLQGKGSPNFDYSLTLSRSFLNRNLNVLLSASSFLPIRYTTK